MSYEPFLCHVPSSPLPRPGIISKSNPGRVKFVFYIDRILKQITPIHKFWINDYKLNPQFLNLWPQIWNKIGRSDLKVKDRPILDRKIGRS